MVCLTGARFNMSADILHQGYDDGVDFEITDTDGEWINQQDKYTGEIIRKWQPNVEDPDTTEREATLETFACFARGIIDGGIRIVATTERFGEVYDNTDYVRIWFPGDVKISRRDRVTNIRNGDGEIIWRDYDVPGAPPIVFSVNGVTPIIDPFGNHIENVCLLERAEIQ